VSWNWIRRSIQYGELQSYRITKDWGGNCNAHPNICLGRNGNDTEPQLNSHSRNWNLIRIPHCAWSKPSKLNSVLEKVRKNISIKFYHFHTSGEINARAILQFSVRSEVLTVVLLRIWVFSDVMLCHWVSGFQYLKDNNAFIFQGSSSKRLWVFWIFIVV